MNRSKQVKKIKQIQFKCDDALLEDSMSLAKFEDLNLSDFSRKLHRIALILFKKTGSLHNLRTFVESVPDARAGKKIG